MRYLRASGSLALLACTASLALTGCGGGGGDDSPPVIRFAPEGFWGGPDINASQMGSTASYTGNCPGGPPAGWNGKTGHFWGDPTTGCNHIGMVVLANGETWGVYTSADDVIGAMHGQATVSGNGVAINNAQFFNIGYAPYSVNYSGTIIPRTQLDMQGTDGIHFVGTYDGSYDGAAALPMLAGVHVGTGGTTRGNNPGTGYAITINGGGIVTLPPDAVGCSASGMVTPHTDKDVFDLNLQFSGAYCALGNGTQINGIAVLADDGHVLMIGATPDFQNEFVFVSN
jgi:hypothetical protein